MRCVLKLESHHPMSQQNGGGYKRRIVFILLFVLLVTPLSASGFSLGASGGIKTTVCSFNDGQEFPLDGFLEPVGINGRIYFSHDISRQFSYGLLFQAEKNWTELDFYRSVVSLDLAAHITAWVSAGEKIEIPFTGAIGGHLEFLGNHMSWGMTGLFETGADWILDEHNRVGFRTGIGMRFQVMSKGSSFTLVIYPAAVSYSYRF